MSRVDLKHKSTCFSSGPVMLVSMWICHSSVCVKHHHFMSCLYFCVFLLLVRCILFCLFVCVCVIVMCFALFFCHAYSVTLHAVLPVNQLSVS